MQGLGFVCLGDKKILVLYRSGKDGKCLKIRKGGKDEHHLTDEEEFLKEAPDQVSDLLEGKTIYL